MLHRRSVVRKKLKEINIEKNLKWIKEIKEMIEILYRMRGEKSTHKKRTGIPHAVVQEPVLAV